MFEVTEIANVTVNVSNVKQALEETGELIASKGRHYVCFFEGNTLHWAYSRSEIRELLNRASLCYPDGIAVAKLMSWKLGKPVSRVSGPTFLLKACEYGVPKGWSHYFFGGKEGVAEALAKTLSERYPGLQVAGTFCPPFRDMTDDEIDALCKELHDKKVDLLWVALGGPRQEKWMNKYLGRIPVPVMLGVGAAFDFHTKNQAWAPKWVRCIGLEWLWRLCTGGKRVFVRNVICVSHVAARISLSCLGRLKYLFVKHPHPSRRLPNVQSSQICEGCDGIPCSQSIPWCPYQENCETMGENVIQNVSKRSQEGGTEDYFSGGSFYIPITLSIHYGNGVIDDKGQIYPEKYHIFIHEYTHLLQDVSSLFALSGLILFFQMMQIRVHDMNTHCAERIKAVWNFRNKQLSKWNLQEAVAFESYTTICNDVSRIIIYTVKCIFINNVNGERVEHNITYRDILESYAKQVESLFLDIFSSYNYTQFEYYVVERIFSKIGITKPENLITICHWALQDYLSPESFLFKMYEIIKSQNYVKEPPYEDIYNLCRTEALKNGFEAKRDAAIQDMADIIDSLMKYSYANQIMGKLLKSYLETVIKNLCLLEDSHYFPIKVFLEIVDNYKKDGIFRNIWTVEMPYVTNDDGIAFKYCHSKSNDMENLALILSSIRYLLDKSENHYICNHYRSCTLKCKTSKCNSNIKEFCKTRNTTKGDCSFIFALRYLNMYPDDVDNV